MGGGDLSVNGGESVYREACGEMKIAKQASWCGCFDCVMDVLLLTA